MGGYEEVKGEFQVNFSLYKKLLV